MKILNQYLLLLLVVLTVFACQKESVEVSEEISQAVPKIQITSADPEWTEKEKKFFNLTNSDLESNAAVRGEEDLPNILIATFNKIVADNSKLQFIDGVVGRIGYPRWLDSHMSYTYDGSKHLLYIPFQKPEENSTSAYMVAYIEQDKPQKSIRLNIKLRADLEAKISGDELPTRNTCFNVNNFMLFDSLIYNISVEPMADLFCESCFGDPTTFAIENASTRCENVELNLCYLLGSDELTGGAGGGWINTSDPTTNWNQGVVITYGGGPYDPNNNPGGSHVGDFGNLIGAVGGAIGGVWRGIVKPKKYGCYKHKKLTDAADTRDDEEYICNEYDVIICQNGDWWEIVEVLDCLDCEDDDNDNGDEDLVCGMNATKFNMQNSSVNVEAINEIVGNNCACGLSPDEQNIYNNCTTEAIMDWLEENDNPLLAEDGSINFPTCSSSFPFKETGNGYVVQLDWTRVTTFAWQPITNGDVLPRFWTAKVPHMCITVRKKDKYNTPITKEKAAELTAEAFDYAKLQMLEDGYLGLIPEDGFIGINTQATSLFIFEFRNKLLDLFVFPATPGGVYLGEHECEGDIPESTPKFDFFGLCLPVQY